MIIYNRTEYKALSLRQYSKEKKRLQVELLKLQEWVIKYNKRIAVVMEGRDAAGKGSTIKRFIENMMPKAMMSLNLVFQPKNKTTIGLRHGIKGCPKKVKSLFLIGAGILGQ